jgi:predicted dehydrogenase
MIAVTPFSGSEEGVLFVAIHPASLRNHVETFRWNVSTLSGKQTICRRNQCMDIRNQFKHHNAMVTSNDSRKVRYAVVGLGWISQASMLPAFQNATHNSELVALVSSDSTKLKTLSETYGIQNTYSYDEYEECLESGEIDAVYIALPNHLHKDYTIRAAEAGIHVLCEKPMAVTEAECTAMIHACDRNAVKLMIAYRLHFEEANLQAIEQLKSGQIGDPRIFNSVFTQQVKPGDIRLQKATGGGTLDDIGIYCINAARYLFQDEPIEVLAVSARNSEERFQEVEEMTSSILRFPSDRLATFTCSFGAAPVSTYHVVGTQGDLRLQSAYGMTGITHFLTINGETQEQQFPPSDQFAAQLVYFSDCILSDRQPEPSGMEGLNDVRIIRALQQSIETGQPVSIPDLDHHPRPTLDQLIQFPTPESPEKLVNASDPSGNS